MPDKYEISTQYVPALLNSVPFIALGYYYLGRIDPSFWHSVSAQKFGGVTMATAIYILAAFSCRHTGKWLEDKMFCAGVKFPTTRFLLDGDSHLSPERKKEIVTKIKYDFGIDLDGRSTGTTSDRKRLHEAVGQIRKKFFKKNDLITQRNIQFGFSKNLAGGALNAVLASLFLAALGWQSSSTPVLHMALMLIIVYILMTGYGLVAMRSNAERYAYTLFEEFIGS